MKANREKQHPTYRGKFSNDSEFLIRIHGGQKEVAFFFHQRERENKQREHQAEREVGSPLSKEPNEPKGGLDPRPLGS